MTDETIFATALERLDPAERSAYLDSVCAGDAEQRRRLEALLAAHDRAGDFLARPAVASPEPEHLGTKSFAPDEEHTQSHDGAAPTTSDDALGFLAPPRRPDSIGRIGHYEVLEVLGQGGFGIVYRALDEVLQRVVAVKVLAPSMAATSPARKRFLREARSSAQIKHENVVHIYATEEQPLPFLVMEFIPGETLQQRLDRTGPLDVPEVLRIGRQIADGLAAAHANGLIHRDIKPSNILIDSGPPVHVKITDFGLARAADDASISQSGVVAGTPMYMAPEQAKGETLDHRADLFSLGSVLYVMCSGRPPFRAESTLAVLKRVAEDAPRPIREIIPEVPEWLCRIIEKLHAKNPDERFQSAKEVADLLNQHLAHLQQPAEVPMPAMIPSTKLDTAEHRVDAPWPAALFSGLSIAMLVLSVRKLIGMAEQQWAGVKASDIVGLTIYFTLMAIFVSLAEPRWRAYFERRTPTHETLIPPRTRNKRWKWLAAATFPLLVLSGLLFGHAAILYASNRGEVEFEDLAIVEFSVFRDDEWIADWKNENFGQKLKLPPGRYTVKARPRNNIYSFHGWTVTDINNVGNRVGGTTTESDPPHDLSLEVKRGRGVVVQAVMRKRPQADIQRDDDSKGFQGDWIAEEIKVQWKSLPEEDRRQFRITFTGDNVRLTLPGGKVVEGKFHLDASRNPREIDIIGDNNKWVRGIYHLDTIWIGDIDGPRPLGFGASLDPNFKQMEVRLRRASAAEKDGWVQLFNGTDMTGWKTHPDDPSIWAVEDGVIVGRQGESLLFTDKSDYADFHLRVEAKINASGDAGVIFRTPFEVRPKPDRTVEYTGGYEAQINLRPSWPIHTGSLSRALGSGEPAAAGVLLRGPLNPHRVDEWFLLEVIATENHIQLRVNGKTTADYFDQQNNYRRGHIALQNWSGIVSTVQFRKIEIKELLSSPKTPEQIASEEAAKLNGEWILRRGQLDGEQLADGDMAGMKLHLWHGKFILPIRNDSGYPWALTGTYTIDAAKKHIAFTFTLPLVQEQLVLCTYRIDGDTLVLDFPELKGGEPPTGTAGVFAPFRLLLSQNNLKQLGLAMDGYMQVHGALPPAAITDPKDKDGKPLLSWRVAILPYIEQHALYQEFRLNEPWDSENNLKLIARMPKIYATPGTAAPPDHTHYRVFVGPGTAFEPRRGAQGLGLPDFDDSLHKTILIVEAADPVIWTKPDDLPYDPKKPLPKLAVDPGSAKVVMGDASVWRVSPQVTEKAIRRAIERNNGDAIPDEQLRPIGAAINLEYKRAAADKDRLQGKWRVVSMDVAGRSVPVGWGLADLVFAGDRVALDINTDNKGEGTFTLDTTRNPKEIDVALWDGKGRKRGIYILEGKRLNLCLGDAGAPRPTSFVSGDTSTALVLERDDDYKSVQLFDGKSLTGWKVDDKQPGEWAITDGVLVGKNGILRSTKTYRDFACRMEIMVNEKGMGDFHFRSSGGRWAFAPIGNRDLSETTGSLAYWDGKKSHRLVDYKRERAPSDKWLVLEVIVRGKRAQVVVNHVLTAEKDIGEMAESGFLELNADPKSELRIRKIEIDELPPLKAGSAPVGAVLLKKFDPAKDKAVPLRGDARKIVSVEDGAWRIENAFDKSVSGNFRVALGTITDGIPEDGLLILRAKVKLKPVADNGGWGDLELNAASPSFHGYNWPEHLSTYRGEITEWTEKEVRYPVEIIRKKNPPTVTVHVGLHGNGVLWVKEVELLHLPASKSKPPSKAPPDPAALQPLRDLVTAAAKSRDMVKTRHEAGAASKLDLVAAEVTLTEARIRLAREEGDQTVVVGLHEVLVAHRQEERDLIAARVKAGVDAADELTKADARLADAKARLAKEKPPLPAAPEPRKKP